MRHKLILLLFITSLFISGCKEDKYKEYICELDLNIELFSDSSFFSDIRCMQYFQDKIYALDAIRREIIYFNDNFLDTYTFRTSVTDSEEMNNPVSFYIQNDTAYILDIGINTAAIKSFYRDDFLDVKVFSKAQEGRFFSTDNFFVIPYVTDTSSFLITSKKNDRTNVYKGSIIPFSNQKKIYLRNDRDLFCYENYIYSISDNHPIIEKYDTKTFKKVEEFDLSQVPIIKKNLKFINSQIEKSNSYYVQIEDSYLTDNSLYLLCANLGNSYTANTLIRLSLYPELRVKAIYKLPGKIYYSFCVSPEYIFCFNKSSSTIERIKL